MDDNTKRIVELGEDIIRISMRKLVDGEKREDIIKDFEDNFDNEGHAFDYADIVKETEDAYLQLKEEKASDKKILRTVDKNPGQLLRKHHYILKTRRYIDTFATYAYEGMKREDIEKRIEDEGENNEIAHARQPNIVQLRKQMPKIVKVSREMKEKGKTLDETKAFIKKHLHSYTKLS